MKIAKIILESLKSILRILSKIMDFILKFFGIIMLFIIILSGIVFYSAVKMTSNDNQFDGKSITKTIENGIINNQSLNPSDMIIKKAQKDGGKCIEENSVTVKGKKNKIKVQKSKMICKDKNGNIYFESSRVAENSIDD